MIGPLLLAFIVVPIVEIYVIIQVGHQIGAWWTVFALIAESVVGAWLVKREGRRAWRTLVAQLSEGRAPTKAAADGAVILVGGVLLLTPGFVTDFFGFLCVIPFTRPLIRRALVGWIGRRSARGLLVATGPVFGEPLLREPDSKRRADPDVIEGHLVDPPEDRA
jgi:UPF0716 protein FxsA